MPKMPQTENQVRWKPISKLRNGQQRLYEVVSSTRKKTYTIQLPTGYGKSWCACITYAVAKDREDVDRMLIVVPTDQQRSQYVSGLVEDLAILNIDYQGIERCDNNSPWVIKKSLRNQSDIFVAGIGSIVADPDYYRDLMSTGRWLVVADEFHHYGEDNSWGAAIKTLKHEVILGMSATPLRADKKPTIFGKTEFDVSVSIEDAYKEKAIRRVCGRIGDYAVSWSSLDSPDPQNSLMSELPSVWGSDISEYELKKGVRYYGKYVSSIFGQVLSTWVEYEAKYPKQNQILVFAMSCRHAEWVAKTINDLAFPGMPEPFADWIGVGEGGTESRTDDQNAEILKRFQENKLPCLVQVNKAGEGFNNKRCSIGLMLDLVGDSPMKRQHIGRFMRVNPATPDLESVIFVSEDSPCRALLENFEEEFSDPDVEDKEKKDASKNTGDRQLTLPAIVVIDTEYRSERMVYPYGSPEAATEIFWQQNPKAYQAYEALPDGQKSEVLKMIRSELDGWLHRQNSSLAQPLTSEEKRKQVAEQVKRCVGIVVNVYLRKRFGKSYPKSAVGDVHRLVNGRYAKEFGAYQADMDEEDLRRKHEWLQELLRMIQQDQIPTWMDL